MTVNTIYVSLDRQKNKVSEGSKSSTHYLSDSHIENNKVPSTLPLKCYQLPMLFSGATGSGKTTQVPQYILDHYIKQKRYCNIIVTQPRRIAAISIAKRVCQERSWDMGGLVGYQVARDKSISDDTRISYVTTGVLLQKLITSKSLNEYTHVILDEVLWEVECIKCCLHKQIFSALICFDVLRQCVARMWDTRVGIKFRHEHIKFPHAMSRTPGTGMEHQSRSKRWGRGCLYAKTLVLTTTVHTQNTARVLSLICHIYATVMHTNNYS